MKNKIFKLPIHEKKGTVLTSLHQGDWKSKGKRQFLAAQSKPKKNWTTPI